MFFPTDQHNLPSFCTPARPPSRTNQEMKASPSNKAPRPRWALFLLELVLVSMLTTRSCCRYDELNASTGASCGERLGKVFQVQRIFWQAMHQGLRNFKLLHPQYSTACAHMRLTMSNPNSQCCVSGACLQSHPAMLPTAFATCNQY